MSATTPEPAPPMRERPLVVDLVRAYEGILLGLVFVLVAAIASGGGFGVGIFTAFIVIPGALMLLFMRQGAPPRRLYAIRASGALLGWAFVWIFFIPLYLAAYLVGSRIAGDIAVFVLLALLDGVVLGSVVAAVDRVGRRFWPRALADAG